MFKYVILLLVSVACAEPEGVDVFQCSTATLNGRTPVCFIKNCTDAIATQIKEELDASFSYMFLATHFDDDRQARPGLAKFLYESASEEREHAMSMLGYLEKRGVGYNTPYSFEHFDRLLYQTPPTYEWALNTALKMEISVTDKIYEVIKSCDRDFHGADFFTEPILEEQHDGIRKLQGAIQSFVDLRGGHNDVGTAPMAEFLFDQRVLKEGI